MRHAQMQAYVYKSLRKADTYVYLAARDDFEIIPGSLRPSLGELAFVLEVALTAERKLARGDAAQVRENLQVHGFHPVSYTHLDVYKRQGCARLSSTVTRMVGSRCFNWMDRVRPAKPPPMIRTSVADVLMRLSCFPR